VFSKYVGEGERTLRAAFARARRAAPAILLLDEIDGMVGSRGSGGGGDASDVGARILSVLLTVGLYKFNPVYPQRLKAPGFNP
jgi:SpoVK/Ycf46/Vps4 family AAA+-type ATPase